MSEGDNFEDLLGLRMKRRLAKGELCVCLSVRFARSIEIVQIARLAGYDALYLDLEHSTFSLDQASQISQAAAFAGLVPIVRVPSHDHLWMSRALDGGAQGVIVPHVDTAGQAADCVRACRYPPLGSRSLAGPGPLAGRAMGPEASYRLINSNTVLIVMLESPEAVANAEAIAAVEGVDMLLIGTNDLCAELGIPGKLDHPKVHEAYRRTAEACRRHSKVLGVGGIKEGPLLGEIVSMGGRFFLGRVDGMLLQQAAAEEVKGLRQLVSGG